LGTSNNDDVKNDFGKKMVKIECLEESKELINNVFSKEESDFRKDWLAKFNPETNVPNTNESIDISDFINKELITFSVDDCKRSIPSLLDGLKESQRKVLYSAIKRNLSFKAKWMILNLSGRPRA
jgi:DNA topoisomerase-2